MAHGVTEVLSEGNSVKMVTKQQQQQQNVRKTVGVMGSRRIFAPAFKLKVLDSYRNDIDCRGNQRATARKYGIHRRQIQKWLQCEENLRSSCAEGTISSASPSSSSSSSSSSSTPSSTTSTTMLPMADGPAVESPSTGGVAPAATTPAPALNLSLARLHGDELAARQGLAPPPRRRSPASPRYSSTETTNATTNVLSARATPPDYAEYPPQERHVLEEATHPSYPIAGETNDRKYYPMSGENRYDLDGYPRIHHPPHSLPAASTEAKLYQQSLVAYHRPAQEHHRYPHQCNGDNTDGPVADHRRHHRHRSYAAGVGGGIESPPRDSETHTPLLAAPTPIKTERASPDSAATPGPCDAVPSPGVHGAPSGPSSPAAPSALSPRRAAAHSESARASPARHAHEREHACPPPPPPADSENRHEKRAVEKKEEVKEEEMEEPDEGERSRDYVRYVPPLASRDGSGPASPELERAQPGSSYSGPPSPRGPGSSGRSSTSSDSESDPLDYSSGAQVHPGDLARRRSFSLRFKLDVLDAFHRDAGVAGNQRATARKFGINRRQVQKWLSQETELRGEIALRGGCSRQRLGPVQESTGSSAESPVDLRTNCAISAKFELELDTSSPPSLYCCELATSQGPPYYTAMMDSPREALPRPCTLSCCVADGVVTCYRDYDSQRSLYCYSPRDAPDVTSASDAREIAASSPLKRPCTMSCCYEGGAPSPRKRLCPEIDEGSSSGAEHQPPQEAPLCLVKPKRTAEVAPVQAEPVTSTVPTPPAPAAPPAPSSKKDAILFKPYLDNPISKSTEDRRVVHAGISPGSNNNNNNCQVICNLNDDRGHDYALELSLRVPIAWRTPRSPYADFPRVRSAFVRYPASPHYYT